MVVILKTEDPQYAKRLVAIQLPWWKRLLDVQLPYRLHVRHLKLGRTLDVGCGIGRVLAMLGTDGVGVDHNREAVEVARQRGFLAYTPQELRSSADGASATFDSLLFAHVLEHMSRTDAVELIRDYLPLLRPGGRVVVFTPQELGFRSDSTHVELMDFDRLRGILNELGLETVAQYSFPFPRAMGRMFKYNEFVSIARTSTGPVVPETP
jgi:2-polyprenyl-3-methyl-5-hydroxy-6-metoxy-1,4-benzoquinol methylase